MAKRDVLVMALEHDYRRRLGQLTEQLRSRIESGELAPWHPNDARWGGVRRGHKTPDDVLEELCRRELASTREAAHLVLAISPHGAEVDAERRGATVDPASSPARRARDVLELGRIRGWYVPAAGRRNARRAV